MASSTSLSLTSPSHLHKPFFSSSPSRLNPPSSFSFHLRTIHKPLHLQNRHLFTKIRSSHEETRGEETRATPITKDMWENSVLRSEAPVLVEFYANWCGPCKPVHRLIDEIAAEYAGRLNCFVVNTDTDIQIAEDYEVKAVPLVILFKNGHYFDSLTGTMPKKFYVTAIERMLNSKSQIWD